MPYATVGTPAAKVSGVSIFVRETPDKRTGKMRLLIQIRQLGNKRWKVIETLSYSTAVDIKLEEVED